MGDMKTLYGLLVEEVSILASSSDQQIKHLNSIGDVSVDELALDFDAAWQPVIFFVKSEYGATAYGTLSELDTKFDEMSGEDNKHLWTYEGLKNAQEWEVIRDIAGQHLSDLWEANLERAKSDFKVGDIYEDGAYHPVLCTEVETEERDVCLYGISLIDGSHPRSCSVMHSGPIKFSVEEAWERKLEFEKALRLKIIEAGKFRKDVIKIFPKFKAYLDCKDSSQEDSAYDLMSTFTDFYREYYLTFESTELIGFCDFIEELVKLDQDCQLEITQAIIINFLRNITGCKEAIKIEPYLGETCKNFYAAN